MIIAISSVRAAIPKLISSSRIFSAEYSVRKLLINVEGMITQGSRFAMDLLPSSVIFPDL